MGIEVFLVSLFAALIAGAVSGLSGFGYALVSVPLFLLVLEPTAVIVVSALVGLFTNALVVSDSFRDTQARLVGSLLPWAIIGQIVGVEVLRRSEPVYIQLAAGLLVVVFSVFLLCGLGLPGLRGRFGTPLAGTASGLMSTSTGLAGPPIVMLFAARKLEPKAFRASNGAYFFAVGFFTLCLLLVRDMIELEYLLLAAALIPAAFVGKSAGSWLFNRIPSNAFRATTLYLALFAGIAGVISAVLNLI